MKIQPHTKEDLKQNFHRQRKHICPASGERAMSEGEEVPDPERNEDDTPGPVNQHVQAVGQQDEEHQQERPGQQNFGKHSPSNDAMVNLKPVVTSTTVQYLGKQDQTSFVSLFSTIFCK